MTTPEPVPAVDAEVEALRVFTPAVNNIAGLVSDNHDAMLVSGAVRILVEDFARRLTASQAEAAALRVENAALKVRLGEKASPDV